MGFTIVAAVLAISFMAWEYRRTERPAHNTFLHDNALSLIEATALTLAIWFVVTLTLGLLGGWLFYPSTGYNTEDTHIISLNDSINAEGGFFMGISATGSYWYYLPQADGGFILDHTEGTAVVYEDEDESPYVRNYNGILQINTWGIASPKGDKPRTEIHVPRNTIIRAFDLDAN